MYMYVHVCTCMYMCVHVCTCMYMYDSVFVQITVVLVTTIHICITGVAS